MATTRKMVLIALADQANDYGEAYPGIESLRRRCSMGLRTVYDSLAQLEVDGYLTRSQLPGKKALYSLNLDRLRQQDLLQPQPFKGAAGAGCGSRRGAGAAGVRTPQGAGNRKPGGAGAALHKSNQELKATTGDDDARERELGFDSDAEDPGLTTARYAEYEALTPFERTDCVDPYLAKLPATLSLPVWASFVMHRKAIRRPLSIAAYQLLLQDFRRLVADGVDLDESLNETIKAGLALPVNPNKTGRGKGQGPPRPRANDDFSDVSYVGTPDHELPPELRDS